ncbi:MAG: hypothetical protein R3C32_03045 [Chloroflexota bacterium]
MTPHASHHARDLGAILAVGVAMVALWQAIVWLGGYQPFVLPGPGLVAERWVRAAAQGTFTPHVVTTLSEILLGLALGVSVGLILGFVLARSALADRLLSPYIVAAQATPSWRSRRSSSSGSATGSPARSSSARSSAAS